MADHAHPQTLTPAGSGHDPLAAGGHAHGHDPNLAHHFEDLTQQGEASSLGMWTFLGTEVMFFGGLIGSYVVYRFTSPDAWALASRGLNVWIATLNTAVLLTSSLAMALAVRAGQLGVKRDQVRYLLLTMALGTLFLVFKGYEYYEEYRENLIPGPHFSVAALTHGHGHGGGAEGESAGASAGGHEAAATPAPVTDHASAEHDRSVASAANLVITPDEFVKRRAQMFYVFYFFMTGLHAAHMVIGLVLLTVMVVWARRGMFTPSYYIPLEVSGLYWHFIDVVWVFLYPLLYLVSLHK